jgi:LysR family hydrogen peroxide-inducible transcriptional activator
MAAMGGSIAVLPSLYAISEAKRDPQLIVRQIIHPLAQRQISLIWRFSSPLAPKFEKIGTIFTDVAQNIMD